MKKLVCLIFLLLSACATQKVAPVLPDFPAVPTDLMQPAPELLELAPDKRNLSDLIENTNDNYVQFYILKERYEEWQNWYRSQQRIWQGLKQ